MRVPVESNTRTSAIVFHLEPETAMSSIVIPGPKALAAFAPPESI